MIVLESNNPEESKIGWFAHVTKNRVNSENWKLVCEHLNNLEISQENTLYLHVLRSPPTLSPAQWRAPGRKHKDTLLAASSSDLHATKHIR